MVETERGTDRLTPADVRRILNEMRVQHWTQLADKDVWICRECKRPFVGEAAFDKHYAETHKEKSMA